MTRRLLGIGLAAVLLGGCLPVGSVATLPPTLTFADVGGATVPMQNGVPVPSFSWQPRPRVELDGEWRVERADLDVALTMGDRDATLAAIEDEAAGRQRRDHDDRAWELLEVPGTTNEPPDAEETGAWYRRSFEIPPEWSGRSVSLRFGSANYIADAWLNGTWLGYHEGARTPFAFDVGELVVPGEVNVLAIRVDTIPVGTRADVLPWGLIDWWNYGGLTGPVWLEASAPTHVVRADVRPHLDAIDLRVLVARSDAVAAGVDGIPEPVGGPASLIVRVLPATVTEENLLDPDPRSLLPDGTESLLTVEREIEVPDAGEVTTEAFSIHFRGADLWSPQRPALYVLHVATHWGERNPDDAGGALPTDAYWTTFGIRHVQVDPERPRVLLNGEASFLRGVGLHAESLEFDANGELAGGSPHQPPSLVLRSLRDAARIGADLLRTGHEPADPTTLMLADRLGFAVWEEIPLYHATPAVYGRTMDRGIPQQMLREMALRDMNHPSVLFHGLSNESTGGQERTEALAELHQVDREIDGTRLTGQAAYGWMPDDPSHAPLDVAGYTSYQGVFYGDDPRADTRRAMRAAHEAHPDKPVMILEFGRWADLPADEERQALIFKETYAVLERFRADRPDGFVSAATWWTLRDFATQLGGIVLEDFGLMRPDGSLRPAGELAAAAFGTPVDDGDVEEIAAIEPELERPRVPPPRTLGEWTLVVWLAYGIAFSVGLMGAVLLILTHRGGRSVPRERGVRR
jgi:beta-glucuronidase